MDRACIIDDSTNEIVNIAEVESELPPLPAGRSWLAQADWAHDAVPLIGGSWNGDTPATFTPAPQE